MREQIINLSRNPNWLICKMSKIVKIGAIDGTDKRIHDKNTKNKNSLIYGQCSLLSNATMSADIRHLYASIACPPKNKNRPFIMISIRGNDSAR